MFERSPSAADAFLTELDKCFAQIADNPQLYPASTKNTRRLVLSGFPYSVFFQDQGDIVMVFAVAHAKRRPGYWHKRI